tara:strand:+ start:153 stop:296 length:144 start_codon:yes stop_codon:yes gene_type:complete
MSKRREKGRRWDGRSRISTDTYKHNYNEIFENKKKTKEEVKKNKTNG